MSTTDKSATLPRGPIGGADAGELLAALSRLPAASSPVVSVYLDTRWTDEHQRERVRVFVAGEVRRARAHAAGALGRDLDWLEAQVAGIVNQSYAPEASGIAVFACEPLGLRAVLPSRVAFEDRFMVEERAYLRPLAEAVEAAPPALIVWTDARHARLVPVAMDGAADELVLHHDVPGHHSRGGWAQLAQSRYQRHIRAEQDRHLEAVAAMVTALLLEGGIDRIVMAGDPETAGRFRERLPATAAARVAATVRAGRHEPAAALVQRALDALGQRDAQALADDVDAAITEAAKGGRAAAGVAATLDAVAKGAVHRLYLLEDFREMGVRCEHCGALAAGFVRPCPFCGRDTTVTELGETLVERVVASGGRVLTVERHAGLAERGGIVAALRHPLAAGAT